MNWPVCPRSDHHAALLLRRDADILQADLDCAVRDRAGFIARSAPSRRGDVENQVRYVALRQRDERRLQCVLADRGLTAVGDALAGRPPADGRGVIAAFAAGRAAHDAPAAWRAMAAHVRTAGREVSRRAQISLDVTGPEPRTGPFGIAAE